MCERSLHNASLSLDTTCISVLLKRRELLLILMLGVKLSGKLFSTRNSIEFVFKEKFWKIVN